MIKYKYNKETIENKRKEISKEIIKKSVNMKSNRINALSISDIKILFELYDDIFFNNYFKENFKGHFKFSVSKRMTKSAGITLCPKNISRLKQEDVTIEFCIGVNLFISYDLLERDKVVCGIETENSLHALQLVLEHEICHAIEFIYFYKSSCKGKRFKTIANDLFGHTSSYHQLPGNKEIAKGKYGLSIGDKVSFIFEDAKLSGLIYNINKRATVMVKDNTGQYADKEGNRYRKYYIPLNQLYY